MKKEKKGCGRKGTVNQLVISSSNISVSTWQCFVCKGCLLLVKDFLDGREFPLMTNSPQTSSSLGNFPLEAFTTYLFKHSESS